MISLPILIPEGFTPVVTSGSNVKYGDLLAEKMTPLEQVLNIADALNISLAKVKHVLKKNPGDNVAKGDIIALKKNIFGKQQAIIISEIEGTVVRYERDSGNLVIRTDQQTASNKLFSPVEGKIDLCNNREIVIVTDKAIVGGDIISGTKAEGELFILEESFTQDGIDNVLYYLDSAAVGKIILGGSFPRDVLVKGVGIGVLGFIGIDIKAQDINYLQEKKITLPVMAISTEALSTLRRWKGKKVSFDAQNKFIIQI